jgi:hypothetical protein
MHARMRAWHQAVAPFAVVLGEPQVDVAALAENSRARKAEHSSAAWQRTIVNLSCRRGAPAPVRQGFTPEHRTALMAATQQCSPRRRRRRSGTCGSQSSFCTPTEGTRVKITTPVTATKAGGASQDPRAPPHTHNESGGGPSKAPEQQREAGRTATLCSD